MSAWSKYPLARLLLAFVTGILMAYYAIDTLLPFYIILAIVLTVIISGYYIVHRRYTRHYAYSILIIICFVLLGIVHTQTYTGFRQYTPFNLCSPQAQNLIVLINDIPVEKDKSIKITGKITQVEHRGSWLPARTHILLYVEKDNKSLQLAYGDKLLLHTRVNEIAPPENPQAFNYQRYLNNKNIYYQSYCRNEQWHLLAKEQGNKILSISAHIRNRLLHILLQSGMEYKEYGILASMLLGSNDNLEADLSQQYANAGVSHILCVSGMHVGIIYLIVNFLFSFMDAHPRTRRLKCLPVLAAIWLYACITGLSASVLRASSMFTFVCIGQLLHQQSNTYNSLLASMLFLLLIKPLLIFEIGFQFSYLAVFGIVWIANTIQEQYHPKYAITEYVWSIVCVSVVAQLFTAPLSMYSFHRFPNYFILPNIVVITMAPFIIGGGIAVLCTSWCPPLFALISRLLAWMIQGVNFCIEQVTAWPGSTTEGIAFSALQTGLLYVVILSTIILLTQHKKHFAWLSLCSLLLFCSLELHRQVQVLHQKEIVFYSTSSAVVADYHHARTCYCYFTDTNSLAYSAFACDNHRIHNRIHHLHYTCHPHYFQLGPYSCLVLDTPLIACPQHMLQTDFLVLSRNQKYNMNQVCQSIQFQQLIIDNSFSPYKKEHLLRQCDSLHIPYHDLSIQAWVIPLNE